MTHIKKVLSFILVFALAIISIPAIQSYAMTEEEVAVWASAEEGQWSAFPGGRNRGQCTALVYKFAWENFGFNLRYSPKDFDTFDVSQMPEGWQKIPYTAGFIPAPGDIVYWNPGTSSQLTVFSTGHTALVVSASADSWVTLDQNWSAATRDTGAPAKLFTRESYALVSGVLRPPLNGKEGHQVPKPGVDITGDTAIFRGESATMTIEFSGIGPWTLVYTADNVEYVKTFNDSKAELTFNPEKTTTYSLKSVTDSSFYEFTESLNEELTVKVLQPDGASSWARDSIIRATKAGLVPQSLQSQYTQAITRAEFCTLAVALYETVMGAEITERSSFGDTDDINVEKMAALGVVNGVGDGQFAPNQTLTREQAATMLSSLAEAIGKPLPEQAPTFADNDSVSSWATDAVGQMQATGIMGGVGNNTFSPTTDYTREQSIITIIRLYSIVA